MAQVRPILLHLEDLQYRTNGIRIRYLICGLYSVSCVDTGLCLGGQGATLFCTTDLGSLLLTYNIVGLIYFPCTLVDPFRPQLPS